MFHLITIALTLCFSWNARAALTADELAKLFTKHFSTRYQARKCFDNILDLARMAGDTEGLYVVSIENRGLSAFGMVNAEAARGVRFEKPAVEEKNWYHHVILLDERGLVYDFDFTTQPTILPIDEYLERMFLDEPECASPRGSELCVGREEKLRYYFFSSVPAEAVLKNISVRPKIGAMSVVLRDWEHLLH